MEDIRDELRTHSRYIRDNLVQLVGCEDGCQLNSRDMALLRSTLTRIGAIPVTLDLLRYSRIEKALLGISAACTGWPTEIAEQAEKIFLKWEDDLGPLRGLRADLWGPGGRLEGVRKLENWGNGTGAKDTDTKSSWSVEGILDPSRPYTTGHIGFPVGSWWIKAAAAFRDGIIDETSDGITANENGAYAIVIKDNQESLTAQEGRTRYFTTGADPGVLKLTHTIIASDVRSVVRVLRSWKLQSQLAPVAGLRYDGLYRVVGFGVTLIQDKTGNDVWKYSFELLRLADQPSIKDALCHPTADEIDDWEDYQRMKNPSGNGSTPFNCENTGGVLPVFEFEKERHGSEDSGYFSSRLDQPEKLPGGRR